MYIEYQLDVRYVLLFILNCCKFYKDLCVIEFKNQHAIAIVTISYSNAI